MLGDTHDAHTKLTQMCLVACKRPSKQTGQEGLLLPRAPHGCSHSLGPPSTVTVLKGAMKVFPSALKGSMPPNGIRFFQIFKSELEKVTGSTHDCCLVKDLTLTSLIAL